MTPDDIDHQLAASTGVPTTRLIPDDANPLAIGQWYWVGRAEDVVDDTTEAVEAWLGCITGLGTNYATLSNTEKYTGSVRIHFDHFETHCRREPDPQRYIAAQVDRHQTRVRALLNDIQRVTAALGIVPLQALPAEGVATQALAVAHGTADITAHKHALIQAKDETLPALFKAFEAEHEQLARWLKAELLPMRAQLDQLRGTTDAITQRIFTVELYAGLTEELTQIQEGAPAAIDTKVHVFQRRHYMDEECLVDYRAVGLEFKNLEAFDRWLLRKRNLQRILPLPRCIAAFRVRRRDKERELPTTLAGFITLQTLRDQDKLTFLYIRNGDQVFRLNTAIDFGDQLFHDRAHNKYLSGEPLYVHQHGVTGGEGGNGILSQRAYDQLALTLAAERKQYADELRAWRRNGKSGSRPWRGVGFGWNTPARYQPCTPASVYYDDVMAKIQAATIQHNRVAVVLQGLLDRSVALHPHPPWRLWTLEGFLAAIELIYDESRALVEGPPPDFEAYAARLRTQIKRGSITIGQHALWLAHEREKELERRQRSWRYTHRDNDAVQYWTPHGNPGPGQLGKVVSISRSGTCTYEWARERQMTKWVRDPDRPGYMKPSEDTLKASFTCPVASLFNVSAYHAGDFKQFYADPRTRANYLQWAPILLAAEDYVVAGKLPK